LLMSIVGVFIGWYRQALPLSALQSLIIGSTEGNVLSFNRERHRAIKESNDHNHLKEGISWANSHG
ncbi:MAG: hypothetical protein WCO89_06470, partial [Syntrophus sp. (in: bacteria)]